MLISYCCFNKLSQTQWFKTSHLLSYSSWIWIQKSKTLGWQGCAPSGGSRRESGSLPFPVSRRHPHPVAHCCVTPTSASVLTCPPFTLILLFLLIRTCVMTLSAQMTQDNLLISRSFTKSHLENPFCQVRFGGLGCGIFFGGRHHYSATTSIINSSNPNNNSMK